MPVIKKRKKKNTYYPDLCFALTLPLIMACHFYGFRALALVAVSVVSGLIADYIGCRIIKRSFKIKNCQSIFIGSLIALMLPATSPWWLPVTGTAFAVLLVKTPFGGVSSSPFSCAAAGFAFITLCFPDLVFNYPVLYHGDNFIAGTSVALSLSQGTPIVTAVDLINAFIGAVPGPMGMTSAVTLLGVIVFVFFKRPKNFINSLSFLLTCFIGAVIITAIDCGTLFSVNVFRVICLRMCSGFTLCIAVFFVTEDPLSPKKSVQRIFYGVFMGIIYIILNNVSVFEDAGCFAVLIINAAWPLAHKYIFRKKVNKTEVSADGKAEIIS